MSEPWHLRKELSVGTILSLVTLGIGSIAAFTAIQADVQQLKDQPKVEVSDVARIEERQKRLQQDVQEIKDKVEAIPAIEEAIRNLSKELQIERDVRRDERRHGQ